METVNCFGDGRIMETRRLLHSDGGNLAIGRPNSTTVT